MKYLSKGLNPLSPARFIPDNKTHQGQNTLYKIYQVLYQAFGPQHWWPGESTLEIIIGAVLTQNTAWRNVEKAIANLKKNSLMDLNQLIHTPPDKLTQLIRPAGYYNIKAKRLLSVLQWLWRQGGIEKIRHFPTARLRQELLQCYGVGRETADSILLYAFNRPVFVVDAYTRRILTRYGLITGKETYEELKNWIENSFWGLICTTKVRIFNEFHALLVKLAKTHCRPLPICPGCPLNSDI